MTAKALHKKLVDTALRCWYEWLVEIHAAPAENGKPYPDASTHEPDYRPMPKVTGEHLDPTLMRIIAQERAATGWPLTIHGLIIAMPKAHRVALLASVTTVDRGEAARYAGVQPHRLCICEGLARRNLAISLAVFDHVRRGEVSARIEAREEQDRQIGLVA